MILLAIAIGAAIFAFVSQRESQRQRRIALGQSLAALSQLVLQRSNDSELATLLALEALMINKDEVEEVSWLADSALRTALGETLFYNNTLTGHEDWVRSVAFSPDGKTLASAAMTKPSACGIWATPVPHRWS